MPICRECGEEFSDAREATVFCKSACRHAFNNRRAARGAVLYDLFMALRYDRGAAKAFKVYSLMCALGKQYREEDLERRHGRPSWLEPQAALAKSGLSALVARAPTLVRPESSLHG